MTAPIGVRGRLEPIFSPRAGVILQFESRPNRLRHRPTRPPGRLHPDRPCPVDDNAMINDPGKQPVKTGTGPVRLSVRLRVVVVLLSQRRRDAVRSRISCARRKRRRPR